MSRQRTGGIGPLDVATWNIHGGRGLENQYEFSQVVDLLERRDPDVIGLQEVDRGFRSASDFDDQLAILEDELDVQARFGATVVRESTTAPDGSPGAYGLAVLCKPEYPIEATEHYLLPRPDDDDGSPSEQRGLLETEIAVGDRSLSFYTTHLTKVDAGRARQVSSVLEIAERRSGPTVLVGDFNATPDSRAIDLVTRRFDDAAVLVGRGTQITRPPSVAARRIDYVFASPDVDVVEYGVVDEVASDHFLVEATLDPFPAPPNP